MHSDQQDTNNKSEDAVLSSAGRKMAFHWYFTYGSVRFRLIVVVQMQIRLGLVLVDNNFGLLSRFMDVSPLGLFTPGRFNPWCLGFYWMSRKHWIRLGAKRLDSKISRGELTKGRNIQLPFSRLSSAVDNSGETADRQSERIKNSRLASARRSELITMLA